MVKKTKQKQPSAQVDIEVRNAFRVITRASKLTGDQISGDPEHLPITIVYAVNEPTEAPDQLNTVMEVVHYAASLLMAMGFSLDGALNVLFSAKATQAVIRDMFAKR